MRRVIAQRLTQSKQQIPHYYLETSVNMDKLLSFRKQVNDQQDIKMSVSDFIIKAVAKASDDVPQVNTQWGETSIK